MRNVYLTMFMVISYSASAQNLISSVEDIDQIRELLSTSIAAYDAAPDNSAIECDCATEYAAIKTLATTITGDLHDDGIWTTSGSIGQTMHTPENDPTSGPKYIYGASIRADQGTGSGMKIKLSFNSATGPYVDQYTLPDYTANGQVCFVIKKPTVVSGTTRTAFFFPPNARTRLCPSSCSDMNYANGDAQTLDLTFSSHPSYEMISSANKYY